MPSNKQQFNLDIWDYSSVAYGIVELILDEEGQPKDWIYRYCNQAFADIKGYRVNVMIDHSFLSLYPQIDKEWLQRYYQAAYENKTSQADLILGEVCHVVVMPVGIIGCCACMIQVMEQEEQCIKKNDPLAEERQMLNKLLPEYVSLYRIDLNSGKYEILRLAENTNARQMVDKNPQPYATYDEYARHYADAFILQEDREEFQNWHDCRNMKRMLRNADKISYYYHSVSRDGKNSYYEAYAVKGKWDEQTCTIFLGYRNIDNILYKEKAIQEKLQKALEEVRLSNEIISSIAKAYQYISRIDIQADCFEEIINKDKKHLNFIKSGVLSSNNQRVCREFVAEEYQEAFFRFTDIFTLPKRMKNEESIALEYRMKDGNWHRMRFIEKKRDASGKLTHVLCAIRSISETKKKEQELLYQVAEAKKDAAQKSRFLSNMSHDIRTPMNGIIGMIDLANRYPDDLDMQQKCRDKIMKSSRYLVSLVNDILEMNKLESGDFTDQEIPFDLAELLNRVNRFGQTKATEKEVEYIVDWGKAGVRHRYLIGNPVYAERLLMAVADNAVKFTGFGGKVHVWCEEKEKSKERVVYEFGCTDNGIGMNQSFLEHAFDMFSQENETSRTTYEGIGLGLAIAKKLADRLNGTIELESQKGRGTTVLIRLPFQIGQERKGKTDGIVRNISLEGLHVLVAEDNELNMEIVKFILEENGMEVDCAMDGEDVIQKFEKAEPGYYDVICMDIMMPKLNGWEAARKIRSLKRSDAEKIPIIAMSANAFAEDIINSHISGMNHHLTKPLDTEKLLSTIKDCLNQACRNETMVTH